MATKIERLVKSPELSELIDVAGGFREASNKIKLLRGFAPSKSTLHRAANGNFNPYVMECILSDLKEITKKASQ